MNFFFFLTYNLIIVVREKNIRFFRKNRLFIKFLTYYNIGLKFFYDFFYNFLVFVKFFFKVYNIIVNFFYFGLFKISYFFFVFKNKAFKNFIKGLLLSSVDFFSLISKIFFLILCSFVSFLFLVFFEFFFFLFSLLKQLKLAFIKLSFFLVNIVTFFSRCFFNVFKMLNYFFKIFLMFIIIIISLIYVIFKLINFLFIFFLRVIYTFFFILLFFLLRPLFFLFSLFFISYNYVQTIAYLFVFKKFFKSKILGFVNVLCIIYTVLSNKEVRNKIRVRGLASFYSEFLKKVGQKHPLNNIFFFNSFQVSDYFFYDDILSSKQTFYDISKKLKSFYNVPIGVYLFNRNFHDRFLSKNHLLLKTCRSLKKKKLMYVYDLRG